jgi:hypothetical protein
MELDNFKVEMVSEGVFLASWEVQGARFHVFIDAQGELVNGTLYKNPSREIPEKGEGWFETRHLKARAKSNAGIIREIERRVAERDLISRATEDKRVADFTRQREQDAAEEIYGRAALHAAAQALGQTGEADDTAVSGFIRRHLAKLSRRGLFAFARTFIAEFRARLK